MLKMNKVHTKYLRMMHPWLFKVRVDCGDGWFTLLKELGQKLVCLQKRSKISITTTQIKEKFGGLRFYYVESSKEPYQIGSPRNIWSGIIADVVHRAEERSTTICEHCGNYGEIKSKHGWLTCLCDKCRKKMKK
jgi:hypothetical protein